MQVIWNGAHENHDHDLLLTPAVLEKRYPLATGENETARYGRITRAINGALDQWRTVAELAQIAGCSTDQVHIAFRRLALMGKLQIQEIPRAEWGKGRSRPRKRYRWAA